MNLRLIFKFLIYLIFVILIDSCNIYKQVPNGSSVLVNNEIVEIDQEKDIINDYFYKDELTAIPIQKRNNRLFGLPVSQHIWAHYNKKKVTRFTQWMKTKIGNAPVIFDSTTINQSKILFGNYYFNKGFFNNKVNAKIRTKGKKTVVRYEIQTDTAFRIRNIYFDSISPLQKLIYQSRQESYIQKKDVFNIQNFSKEIERIVTTAQNHGYYTFNKEFVKFRYDTFQQRHELDVYVKIIEESDTTQFQIFKIDTIRLLIHQSDERNNKINKVAKQEFGNIQFIQEMPEKYDNKFLRRFIFQRSDSIFSKEYLDNTIQKLSELNNFKLINTNILQKNDSSNKLDILMSLTPHKKRSISIGQSVYNSTLGLLGTSTQLNYTNKNFSSRADRLSISLSGSADMNVYLNNNQNNNAGFISRLDLSLGATYNIDKFLVSVSPFHNNSSYLYNRTTFNGYYTYSKRLGFYDIHNITSTAGYEWSKKRNNHFSYFPLSFTYIIIPDGSIQPEFERTLELSPFLRSAFTPTFILGSNFNYVHRNDYGRLRRNSFVTRSNIELAGNSAYVANKIFSFTDEKNIRINDIDVSQFFKLQSEIISNNFLNKSSSLHSRLKFGFVLPYGNSDQIPYVRQFFLGGQYSLRAFQARTIGPGNINPGQFDTDTSRVPRDQLGNMMIEANLEYRFNMISVFKGAIFLDAGNIWNTSERFNPDPKAIFRLNEFYKQFYVGSGVGLRVDLNYFLMRLDLGIPMRVPYLQERDWVIEDAKPFNSTWIRDNVVLNFAVGVPF